MDQLVIEIRPEDGYVNATKLCKSLKKRWNDYYSKKDAKCLIHQISISTGLPFEQIVQAKSIGGIRRTWVHPEIASDLKTWCLKLNANDRQEARIRDALCLQLSGTKEVPTKYGYADIVTDDEIVEVKRVKGYLSALGQVLGYGEALPGRRRRVHLFGTKSELEARSMKDIKELFESFGVMLTWQEIASGATDVSTV